MVIAGLVVAILPFAHRVQFEPDLILLVFLPPLVYDASLDTSAREFRTHWRLIPLLAVGLVLATMTLVAVVFHLLVPQSSWGEAFALGAIVPPPDSVAASQIAGKLGLPRRLVTILGGEGLTNDATALTAYQVAVASVATTLTVGDVTARFLFDVAAGVGIGLAVGWAGTRLIVLALNRIDGLAAEEGTPDRVATRLRTEYEALLDQVDRRLDLLSAGDDATASAAHPDEESRAEFEAEVELCRRVIAVERDELDRLVARRKVSRQVAEEVRAALDIDETTMRP